MVLSSSSIKSSASQQQPGACLPLDSPVSGSETPQAHRDTLPGSNPPIPPLVKIREDVHKELETLTVKERFQHANAFSKMFVKVVLLLAAQLDVDVLKLFLSTLVHPRTKLPYIDGASYQHCLTTKEVLKSLHPLYINVYHLGLLREIVDFSESAEAKALLGQYESTLPYSIPLSQLESPLTEDNIRAVGRSATHVQGKGVDRLEIIGMRKL